MFRVNGFWCAGVLLVFACVATQEMISIKEGGLEINDVIILKGLAYADGSFAVNLKLLSGDTALHFRPYFRSRLVYRNAYISNLWGEREVYGNFPFLPNKTFLILILVDKDDYQIAVDGAHFISFTHRVSPNEVRAIETWGEVAYLNISISKDSRDSYPYPLAPPIPSLTYIHQPATPFLGKIPYILDAGRSIRIWGRLLAIQNRLEISLQRGSDYIHDDASIVGLHAIVLIELIPKQLSLNAYAPNITAEERVICPFFTLDENFSTHIQINQLAYKVTVNGNSCGEMMHKVPVRIIDYLFVTGAVRLYSVEYL